MAIVVMLVLVGRCESQGNLKLANVLGDSMVLQVMPAYTPFCHYLMTTEQRYSPNLTNKSASRQRALDKSTSPER
jgi:hypothetical protein